MFRSNVSLFVPFLLLALLLVSCTADSESYTDPRINPDEALTLAPPVEASDSSYYTDPRINPEEALADFPYSGLHWPSFIDSDFYTAPRINPDEAPGDWLP